MNSFEAVTLRASLFIKDVYRYVTTTLVLR